MSTNSTELIENPAIKPNKNLANPTRKYNHVVNKELAVLRAIQGKDDGEIAEEFNVSRQAINALLKPVRDDINGYKAFKDDKASIFEFKQYQLVKNLDDKSIKKIPGVQKITGIGILQDKIANMRGEKSEPNEFNQMIQVNIDLNSAMDKLLNQVK